MKVLMYHAISSNCGATNGEIGADLYCVPERSFIAEMQYVKEKGAENFIITFDDGNLSNYKYAYPILKEMGIRAYFFIIVCKVGKRGYMNWEQIKELRDNGMVIGSHGMTHRILTELKDEEVHYELGASRKFIKDNIGNHIENLSVPRGFYNGKIIDKAKACGYKRVFTSNVKDSDGYKYGRISIKRDWELKDFIKVVNGFSIKQKSEELIKSSSKKILGAKNYDRVRSVILKGR